MHLPLLLGIWLGLLALLMTGNHMVHRTYTRKMQTAVKTFEADWKHLEKRYEKLI